MALPSSHHKLTFPHTQLVVYHIRLFASPWTVACQAPLSVEFSRQKYWSGLQFPSPGDLPDPEIKPESPASQALAGRFFTREPSGKTPVFPERFNLRVNIKDLYIALCHPSVSIWYNWEAFVKAEYILKRQMLTFFFPLPWTEHYFQSKNYRLALLQATAANPNNRFPSSPKADPWPSAPLISVGCHRHKEVPFPKDKNKQARLSIILILHFSE